MNVLDFLHTSFGAITDEQVLPGVAGDGAIQLKFVDGNTLIIKSARSPRERSFYESHADLLRHASVGVPELHWSGSDHTGRHWIVIEHIPNPFPQERWRCDPEQMKMLVRLHAETWNDRRLTLAPEGYKPGWNQDMTRQAFEWFKLTEREHVSNGLTMLQREAQSLFQPLCCISADPNPTNWRLRKNGELVLIDWERFSHGHPAIDLGITMPGLGSKDGLVEQEIADLYQTCWRENIGCVPPELSKLERWIRLGKLWSMVEFAASARVKPELYPQETVRYIVRELPELIRGLLKSNYEGSDFC